MERPHDADGQRNVLRALLKLLETASDPATYVELPFVWPETRAQARNGAEADPPIAELLKHKPWLLEKLISGDFPDVAARKTE